MGLLEAFKKVATPEQAPRLRAEMPSGRIFYGRTMLAERNPGDDIATPILTNIHTLWPSLTHDQIMDHMKTAMEERDRLRKGA